MDGASYWEPFDTMWGYLEDVSNVGITIWGCMLVIKFTTWVMSTVLWACYEPINYHIRIPRARLAVVLVPSMVPFFTHQERHCCEMVVENRHTRSCT